MDKETEKMFRKLVTGMNMLADRIKTLEDKSDVDHTIICNSLGCEYNNGGGKCVVVEIEIRDENCESFVEIN